MVRLKMCRYEEVCDRRVGAYEGDERDHCRLNSKFYTEFVENVTFEEDWVSSCTTTGRNGQENGTYTEVQT